MSGVLARNAAVYGKTKNTQLGLKAAETLAGPWGGRCFSLFFGGRGGV